MKKKRNAGYYWLLSLLGLVLLIGIFLLIIGLQMGPEPLMMPWSIDV